MDTCLRFRRKSHLKAHSQDLIREFKLKSKVCFFAIIVFCIGSIIQYGSDLTTRTNRWFGSNIIFGVASLLSLLALYWVGRVVSNKVMKCRKYYTIGMDILIFLCCIFLIADFVLFRNSHLGRIGLMSVGWVLCSIFHSIFNLIGNWCFRIIAYFCFLAAIFVAVVLEQDDYGEIIASVIEAFLIHAFFTYNAEKYEKITYLERYRTNDDFKTVSKILGDVIEGIVIIDQDHRILYSNEAVSNMIGDEEVTVQTVLSKLKVRAVNNPEGASVITLQEGEEKTLLDLYKPILEILFNEAQQRAILHQLSNDSLGVTNQQKFICVEGVAANMRNYHVKMATSTYHEKNVVVVNITDSTDRDAIISLQDNNKYKTRMLASVSHELRTPLNGSINFVEQALNDPDVPQRVKDKFLLPAIRSNRLLLSLINDILDFSQMEADKLRLVFETKNVVDTAQECIELLEIQAKKKGIDLILETKLSKERQNLSTDHNRFKQIILNLLSNAVKFTFQGSVTLTLEEAQKESSSSDRMIPGVKISCRDTGIGISEENKKKLFKAFEKTELGDKTAINSTGAGLGLVIANNLAQRLNGFRNDPSEKLCINFESTINQGSCFYFFVFDRDISKNSTLDLLEHAILPLRLSRSQSYTASEFYEGELKKLRSSLLDIPLDFWPEKRVRIPADPNFMTEFMALNSEQDLLSAKSSAKRHTCKCPPVLIVDDDCFNLTALEMNLSKLQVEFDSAFNGLQALEKIRKRQVERCSEGCGQYQLMFLDCNMPIMDGYETATELRRLNSKGEIDNIKIIACTAFVQQSELDRAIKSGMDDYCVKPITSDMVAEKLKIFGVCQGLKIKLKK